MALRLAVERVALLETTERGGRSCLPSSTSNNEQGTRMAENKPNLKVSVPRHRRAYRIRKHCGCQKRSEADTEHLRRKTKMWVFDHRVRHYHYVYESGREAICCCRILARKAATFSYGSKAMEFSSALRKARQIHHRQGCLYIKKLSDVDSTVLEALIRQIRRRNRARQKA